MTEAPTKESVESETNCTVVYRCLWNCCSSCFLLVKSTSHGYVCWQCPGSLWTCCLTHPLENCHVNWSTAKRSRVAEKKISIQWFSGCMTVPLFHKQSCEPLIQFFGLTAHAGIWHLCTISHYRPFVHLLKRGRVGKVSHQLGKAISSPAACIQI